MKTENLNYFVFLPPQQTKLVSEQGAVSSECVNVITLFSSGSRTPPDVHISFEHMLKYVECFIMTLEQSCELFTLGRHFSDDNLCLKLYSVSSEITFYRLCLRLSSLFSLVTDSSELDRRVSVNIISLLQ